MKDSERDMHQVLASFSNGKLHPKRRSKELDARTDGKRKRKCCAKPRTSCHCHAHCHSALFFDPFLISSRTSVHVCVWVTIYIVTLSSLCQFSSVILCFAQLFKDVPKDVGGWLWGRWGVPSGGVSKQTAAAQLHYPASADGWLLRSLLLHPSVPPSILPFCYPSILTSCILTPFWAPYRACRVL